MDADVGFQGEITKTGRFILQVGAWDERRKV